MKKDFRDIYLECRKGVRQGSGPELLQLYRKLAVEYGMDLNRHHCALCNKRYLDCPCEVVSLAPGSPIALHGVGERRALGTPTGNRPGVDFPRSPRSR